MTVRTPDPPYWAAIFSSRRRAPASNPDEQNAAYDAAAARMLELAREQHGFLGMDSVRDDDGHGITVSYWESEESIRAWKQHAEHREAQHHGMKEWYAAFELRVARVERARFFVSDEVPSAQPARETAAVGAQATNSGASHAGHLADGRIPWFQRSFELGRAPEELRELQQRLATGPARIAVALRGIDEDLLRTKPAGAWSILENLGHLGDLEPLWAGRVEDLLSGEEELRPADLENHVTHRANHNASDPQELIDRFTEQRIEWLLRLAEFDGELAGRTALHPRLEKPMSIVDLCFFVAEHDEHHLRTMEFQIARQER